MDSEEFISDFLNPISPKEFFKTYWTKQPILIPGNKEKFEDMFSWNHLNQILASGIEIKNLSYATNDTKRSELNKKYKINSILEGPRSDKRFKYPLPKKAKLNCLCKDKHTFIINQAHNFSDDLKKSCIKFSNYFFELAQTNLYLSPADGLQGLPNHRDTHEIFALQIEGVKHWEFYGMGRPYPLHKEPLDKKPPSEVTKRFTTKKGDILYMPRGEWHRAIPDKNEPSLHLTLGICCDTGSEILNWTIKELTKNKVIVRKNAPLLKNSQVVDHTASVQRALKSYSKEISSFLNSEKALQLFHREKINKQFKFYSSNNSKHPHIKQKLGPNGEFL